MLTKILANTIQQYINRIKYNDQVVILYQWGFIPGIQRWFNIGKPITVIHHVHKVEKSDHFNNCRKSMWENSILIHDLNTHNSSKLETTQMSITGECINKCGLWIQWNTVQSVSYTHLTLPTTLVKCRSRWSPYH